MIKSLVKSDEQEYTYREKLKLKSEIYHYCFDSLALTNDDTIENNNVGWDKV